jgi:hypothetical protein
MPLKRQRSKNRSIGTTIPTRYTTFRPDPLTFRQSGGMSEGLPRSASRSKPLQDPVIRQVRNGPVDLAGLEDAIIPGAPVDGVTAASYPEAPEIPELHRQWPASPVSSLE